MPNLPVSPTTTQEKPARKRVRLHWTGSGSEYTGIGETGPAILIDPSSAKGPGPMDALLLSLAGCMAADVQVILERSRVPLTAMTVEVEGERATSHPRYYTRIHLVYRLEGPGEEHRDKLERAVELSRSTYCSVLHSLRPDIDIDIEIRRE